MQELETILKNLAADDLRDMKENDVTIFTVVQGRHEVLYVPVGFIVLERVVQGTGSLIHGARQSMIMGDAEHQQANCSERRGWSRIHG